MPVQIYGGGSAAQRAPQPASPLLLPQSSTPPLAPSLNDFQHSDGDISKKVEGGEKGNQQPEPLTADLNDCFSPQFSRSAATRRRNMTTLVQQTSFQTADFKIQAPLPEPTLENSVLVGRYCSPLKSKPPRSRTHSQVSPSGPKTPSRPQNREQFIHSPLDEDELREEEGDGGPSPSLAPLGGHHQVADHHTTQAIHLGTPADTTTSIVQLNISLLNSSLVEPQNALGAGAADGAVFLRNTET